MKKGKNKNGVISEYLPWLIIAVVVLVIIMISVFVMKGKGFEFIDYLKGLFRGG